MQSNNSILHKLEKILYKKNFKKIHIATSLLWAGAQMSRRALGVVLDFGWRSFDDKRWSKGKKKERERTFWSNEKETNLIVISH